MHLLELKGIKLYIHGIIVHYIILNNVKLNFVFYIIYVYHCMNSTFKIYVTAHGLKLKIMYGLNYGWFKKLSCGIYTFWNYLWLLGLCSFNSDTALGPGSTGLMWLYNFLFPLEENTELGHYIPHIIFS